MQCTSKWTFWRSHPDLHWGLSSPNVSHWDVSLASLLSHSCTWPVALYPHQRSQLPHPAQVESIHLIRVSCKQAITTFSIPIPPLPFNQHQFSSVTQSCLTLQPHGLQHTRPPYLSPTPRIYSNSRPLSRWCHPIISSSVVPFSSCLQSFPASGSFQMNQFFTSEGQSIGVSASASVLSMNIQDWFPLGWTGWISSQSKRLSRVFSNNTVHKHQFFGAQFSL